MEGEASFDSRLAEALEQRRASIEAERISALKQECQGFFASFRALLQVLEKKGLIKEDPYKQVERISEITPPSDEPFLESERDAQMSIRLSQYDNQLDFLVNYFPFDLASMGMQQIRSVVSLIKYIRWHQLTETSTHLMTRTLAEYISRLIHDQDPLSSGIVKDSQEQLVLRSRALLEILKEIAGYRRETAKQSIRTEILPQCRFDPAHVMDDRDAILRQLRRVAAQQSPGTPFSSDLAWEVVEETYSPERDRLRTELLQRIRVAPRAKTPRRTERDDSRTMLLETVRNLATVGGTLSTLIDRTEENTELIKQRKLTLLERFRRWVDQVSNRQPDRPIMHIEMMDENSSTVQSEDLDFGRFSDTVRKRARLYSLLLNRVSTPARRIQEADEEQLFSFLQKQIEELFGFYRRLAAIDTYIRSEVAREQRSRLRGVNVELAALKEHLLRVNKRRHAYVDKKEEREQLRRLGVTPDEV